MIRASEVHRQLDILAFWNVMIAHEKSPVFRAIVDAGCAIVGDYVSPNKVKYEITPLGKEKAFL